jgi:hypothetical protein
MRTSADGDSRHDLLREADQALAPTNARKLDGAYNYKKCIEIRMAVVGSDAEGTPAFVLDATSPQSSVNNLERSIAWNTYERAEAAAFLRQLADKIENGGFS